MKPCASATASASCRTAEVGTPDEIVLKPASDYVRSFFRNVDVSRVFRAGDLARKTQVTIIERQGVSAAAALERMEHFDRDVAIILGRDKTYHGMVSHTSLIETARDGAGHSYPRAFLPDIEPIPASESLSNVLGTVPASTFPVPVIDEANHYLGSISKSALLETLDRTA